MEEQLHLTLAITPEESKEVIANVRARKDMEEGFQTTPSLTSGIVNFRYEHLKNKNLNKTD